MRTLVPALLAIISASTVSADSTSPYRGQEAREIKALSPQDVDDYLNGKGLGYAKAAELNRYPGPRHVLDLADQLDLSEEQRTQTRSIFDAMRAEASALGRQLVAKERELDRQFATGSIVAESLEELVSDIGALEARIRYLHLNAHLEQRELLTEPQIRRYDHLRGYATGHSDGRAHAH